MQFCSSSQQSSGSPYVPFEPSSRWHEAWAANAWDGRMSAITSYSPLLPASERPIGRMAQRTLAMIRAWRSRMRQRSELLLLNAVELRELSLTEADVDHEARKLFWEDFRLSGR